MVGTITRPVKELKAFRKVFIKKGESAEVVFTLGIDDLKFYNSELNFVAEPGDFKVFVGGNSRDVKEVGFVLRD
jgi:beta-glucosidase